ncbi:DUF3151 domain-containing protein [Micromonospora avicenniae]|uniref:DUF3151 domain-containing protein n=1 Tax=Micromonospora avicenniae TaxID=1198245 RepID=A0A1N6U6J1_9ACTN|nr:DUF3151 domain-containing protein [Micromonospora avicenniae]SIQ61245.1 Protein of unknown function [Micromonospora avicenniae]
MQNLMPEPPATLLPAHDEADAALAAAETDGGDEALAEVAARYPTYSAAWGALAARALAAGQAVQAYAYARTGYHRGLDQLRRNGWKGHGPVPWSHEPNQGFLRCLYVLSRAADEIGEADEAARCAQFLRDCDPAAADALSSN